MDLQALAHNKPVVYGGAVVVGGAGLFLVMKLRGSGGGASSANQVAAAGTSTGAATVAGGFPDTSGTDIASWLGQANSGLAQQIGDIQTSLGDITTTLGNLQPTTGTGTGGTTPPITVPPPHKVPPPVRKPPPVTRQYVTVGRYTSHSAPWNSTLSGIAGHYHTSTATLLKLNPSIRNPNRIAVGQKIRVK